MGVPPRGVSRGDGNPDGLGPERPAPRRPHGTNRVKAYYVNCLEAGVIFGSSFASLERAWKTWLRQRSLSEAHAREVRRLLGLSPERLSDSYLDRRAEALWPRPSIEDLEPEDRAKWSAEGSTLTGTHDGPWTTIRFPGASRGDLAVRVRFQLASGDAFKLRTHARGAQANDVILTTWGCFLQSPGAAGRNTATRLVPGRPYDLTYVVEEGHARTYLDGWLILELSEGARSDAGSIELGVERGRVEVTEVVLLRP